MKKKKRGKQFFIWGMLTVPMMMPTLAGAIDKVDKEL